MSKYWSSEDDRFHEIPDSKLYVLCNDKFMSGWGKAENMINTCVIPCDTIEEANKVIDYINSRSDQNRIRIVTDKLRTKKDVLYSLLDKWLDLSL